MGIRTISTCTILTTATDNGIISLSSSSLTRPIHADWNDGSSASAYLYGTYTGKNHNTCDTTQYWRTAIPVATRNIINISDEPTTSFTIASNDPDDTLAVYVDNSNSEYSAIQKIDQTAYDAKADTPLEQLGENIIELDTCLTTVAQWHYGDNPLITDIIYTDPNTTGEINTIEGDQPQKNAIFKLGQCEGVSYGFRCQWEQSLQTNFNLLETYTSAVVGNVTGKIKEVRVYVTNKQYALSVTKEDDTVIEPILLTAESGTPLYFYNEVAGAQAIAFYGISEITAVRLDAQADNCGDRIEVNNPTPTTLRVGITDHDEIIEVDGITFYPMYGADTTNKTSGIDGEESNSELSLSLLSSPLITEADLVDGVWDNAIIQTVYVDWAAKAIDAREPPGRLGNIEFAYDSYGALAIKMTQESSMSRLKQKNTHLLTKKCWKRFGSPECGINLYASGFIENLTVTELVDDYSIKVDSAETEDNYYGEIHWSFRDILRSYNVAAYDGATKTLTFWNVVNTTSLNVGTVISAVRRCDKTEANCFERQGHILNHGGAEYLPDESVLTEYL